MYAYQNRIPANARADYEAMCKRLGIKAGDLAICIKAESNFDPSAKNAGSSATGIIQFVESTANDLGTTVAALRQMSFKGQLVYVERYLVKRINQTGIKRPDLYDLYLLIHYPIAAGKPDSYVLYRSPSGAYTGNRGIDINRDGNVTVKEIKAFLNKSVPNGYAEAALFQPVFWAIVLTITIGVVCYKYQTQIAGCLKKAKTRSKQNIINFRKR